nr:molybdenum cofactor guanylyltransferase [Sessilibacter corallicola]
MKSHSSDNTNLIGCILAGGESRRMNGDTKALVTLQGKPMIAHIEQHLKDAGIERWIVSTNTDNDQPIKQVIDEGSDTVVDTQQAIGPLGGLSSCFQWLHTQMPSCLIYTCPCDTPFINAEVVHQLVTRMFEDQYDCVIAQAHSRLHPTIGVWRSELGNVLNNYLENQKNYRLMKWIDTLHYTTCDFSYLPEKTFANINSPTDLLNNQ